MLKQQKHNVQVKYVETTIRKESDQNFRIVKILTTYSGGLWRKRIIFLL